jgi:hypothetical protein
VQAKACPARWLAQLQVLDVSGQDAHDSELGAVLASCPQLTAVNLANTHAADVTLMMLGSSCTTGGTAGSSAGAAGAAGSARQALGAEQATAAAGAVSTPQLGAGMGRCSSAHHHLRVLDVSGCAALAVCDAPTSAVRRASSSSSSASGSNTQRALCKRRLPRVFALFRAALQRLPRLEVLLAAGVNIDAALACGCVVHTAAGSSNSRSISSSCCSGAAMGACSCGLCTALGRLHELDVSAATALCAATMAQLLVTCWQLRRLAAAGCRTLAVDGGSGALQAALMRQGQQRSAARSGEQQQQQQKQPTLGFTHLSLGWGWTAASIACMISRAPCLVSFCAGEWGGWACWLACVCLCAGRGNIALAPAAAASFSQHAACFCVPLCHSLLVLHGTQVWVPVLMTVCCASWLLTVTT